MEDVDGEFIIRRNTRPLVHVLGEPARSRIKRVDDSLAPERVATANERLVDLIGRPNS